MVSSCLPGVWFITNGSCQKLSNCCQEESGQGNNTEAEEEASQDAIEENNENIPADVEPDDGGGDTRQAKPYVIQVEERGDDRVEWKLTRGRPVEERSKGRVEWARPVGEISDDRVERKLTVGRAVEESSDDREERKLKGVRHVREASDDKVEQLSLIHI